VIAVVVLIGAIVVRSAPAVRARGAVITHLQIHSRFVHRRVLTLVTPAGGGSNRPLLVFLHGRGGNQDAELSDRLFAALSALGARAPDIAFPYGGNHSYWHDRAGGGWGSYVLREVIPDAVNALHADPTRIAIGGISMGGFGAYDLARLAPGRFCAVGGHSAALWPAAGDTAPGAFDSATDYARHDVIAAARANPNLYGHARLWLDGGDQDPFHSADEQLAAALHLHMHVWPGSHESAYWNAHWGDYLSFYAAALAACH
jgi:S-formylglutathione hydrolase FrmB